MKRPVRIILLACAAVGLTLTSCGLGVEPAVRLLTNRAEMAAYVDRFNALQGDTRVEIAYQETPFQAVLDGAPGDVVIGEWLASPAVMDRLDALGDIVKPGKIDPSWFYARLLAMGSRDNRPFLIPLSFSLPAVVYLRTDPELPSMFITLDMLQTMSKDYTRKGSGGNLATVGFSPLWGTPTDFLSASALLFGARFRAGRNGLPAFDTDGLRRTVDFARSWLAQVDGGWSADDAFSSRNFVQPWYKLLSPPGKIRFALVPFASLFALPQEKRRDFDYRWLSTDNQIPVLDDALFAGVLRSSRSKKGARAFLQWFCSLATQQSLLNVNQSRRIGVFGITDGFSALKVINEKDLPQKYPLVLGHVPQESLLAFPETLPDNWIKVRDGVVRPWMVAAIEGQGPQELEKTLEDWQKAQKK
jgi:ABC-type glycerol-3-phosphate transport system substrate-binding protein